MTIGNSKKVLQDLARVRKQQTHLNKVLEHSEMIKGRVKKLKQSPNGANWLYQMLTMFHKTYPIDLLAALNELATNKNDNAIIAAIIETVNRVGRTGRRSGREYVAGPLLSMGG